MIHAYRKSEFARLKKVSRQTVDCALKYGHLFIRNGRIPWSGRNASWKPTRIPTGTNKYSTTSIVPKRQVIRTEINSGFLLTLLHSGRAVAEVRDTIYREIDLPAWAVDNSIPISDGNLQAQGLSETPRQNKPTKKYKSTKED